MAKFKAKEFFANAFGIVTGAAVYAAGVVLFLQENHMVSGGIGGLSVVLNHLTDIPTGTWALLLNVPLFILSFFKLGACFCLYTASAVGVSSLWMNFFEALSLPPVTNDRFLAAATGGALIAVGLGVVFRCRATTGGTDIVARLLKLRYPHVKTGVFILVADVLVIVASVFIFGNLESGLYSGVGVLLQAWLFDFVLYGSDSAKLVYVVTQKPAELSRRFLQELSVGLTSVRVTGSYTGRERVLLLCAMHKKVLPHSRALVREVDPAAFLIVTPATQIFGEGFLNHDREEL